MNALLLASGLVASGLLASETALAAVDPEKVKPGWVALVIVLLMGLATFLLWRSMNHQLKKVHFEDGQNVGKAEHGEDDRRA